MTRLQALSTPEQIRRPRLVPTDNVELTCTREVGHVYYSVPPEALPELRGIVCPTCHLGMLDTIERARDAEPDA